MQVNNTNSFYGDYHHFSSEGLKTIFFHDTPKIPEKKDFTGKVISVCTKLNRALLSLIYKIQALWETGRWITLDSAIKNFKEQVAAFDRSVHSGYISTEALVETHKHFKKIVTIEGILETAGASASSLEEEHQKLLQLHQTILKIEQLHQANSVNLLAYVSQWEGKDLQNISDEQLQSIDHWPLEKLDVLLAPFGKSRVHLLRSHQLQILLPHLPEKFLSDISYDQFPQLDLSNVENEQLRSLFKSHTAEFFSDAQIDQVLPRLDTTTLRQSRISRVLRQPHRSFDLSLLPAQLINQVFDSSDIPGLPIGLLQKLLPKLATEDKLKRHRQNISDDQWKQLDLTGLSSHILSAFFNDFDSKVSILLPKQLQPILASLDLSALSGLSREQLVALDLSSLSQNDLVALLTKVGDVHQQSLYDEMSLSHLQGILKKLSPKLLCQISNETLGKLDLSELSLEQLDGLCHASQTFYLHPKEQSKHRFSHLSSSQVQSILTKLSTSQNAERINSCRYMTNEQLSGLDFSNLSSKVIEMIFRDPQEWNFEENKRIQLLTGEQLESISSKLSPYALRHISQAQVKLLNLSALSVDSLNFLFGSRELPRDKYSYLQIEEARATAHFQQLAPADFNSLLTRFHPSCLQFITQEQAFSIDYSQLERKAINCAFSNHSTLIAELSVEQFQAVAYKLNSTLIQEVSDDQLEMIDFSEIKEITCLFSPFSQKAYYRSTTEDKIAIHTKMKKRFARLSAQSVQTILTKLDPKIIALISNEQLSELNLSNLKVDQVRALLQPTTYLDGNDGGFHRYRDDFAPLSWEQMQSILPQCLKLLSQLLFPIDLSLQSDIFDQIDAHIENLDLSQLTQEQIKHLYPIQERKKTKDRFAKLSSEQVESIKETMDSFDLNVLISDQQRQAIELT